MVQTTNKVVFLEIFARTTQQIHLLLRLSAMQGQTQLCRPLRPLRQQYLFVHAVQQARVVLKMFAATHRLGKPLAAHVNTRHP